MAIADIWDRFVAALRDGVEGLAQNTVGDLAQAARADAEAFVQDSAAALKRWLEALANGILSPQDFEALVASEQGLARLHALQAVGVAKARLERFRTGLRSLVVRSAFVAVGI